ncbi:MAG: exodeoxyribonuclease VII large subunit, partial [Candidatus Krumholzibacteria bacterium]|nr:exodeoxyribonuclease VII large subunit [Candidatus Krumholzibacteria bacterium]
IVVITSPTGAVVRDILETLGRRWPVAEVIHICVDVQGARAVRSIIKAFERANKIEGVDVVILARGGGSVEDLWTFNMEGVARAVIDSVHPVITGIGHEIDTTIVDYVSDLRAATPTEAAELATPLIGEVGNAVSELEGKVRALYRSSAEGRLHLLEYILRSSAFPALAHRLERAELRLDDRLGRLQGWWRLKRSDDCSTISAYTTKVERAMERSVFVSGASVARKLERLSLLNPEKRISASLETMKRYRRSLNVGVTGSIALRNRELDARMRALAGLHPFRVLQRGYTYCTTPDGEGIIGRSKDLVRGNNMVVNFYDGGVLCRVERKRKGKSWPESSTSRKRQAGLKR